MDIAGKLLECMVTTVEMYMAGEGEPPVASPLLTKQVIQVMGLTDYIRGIEEVACKAFLVLVLLAYMAMLPKLRPLQNLK